MATHSSIWRIPWTDEPGGLQSMGSQRVRHDCMHTGPRAKPDFSKMRGQLLSPVPSHSEGPSSSLSESPWPLQSPTVEGAHLEKINTQANTKHEGLLYNTGNEKASGKQQVFLAVRVWGKKRMRH